MATDAVLARPLTVLNDRAVWATVGVMTVSDSGQATRYDLHGRLLLRRDSEQPARMRIDGRARVVAQWLRHSAPWGAASSARRAVADLAGLSRDEQKLLTVQYLARQLAGDPGVECMLAEDHPDGFTVTVVVANFWGPSRRHAHDAFLRFRRAFRTRAVGLTVAQSGTAPAQHVVWRAG